jgi:hypothetical protein
MRLARRRLAARYLRILATVDNLVAVDQIAEARRVLGSVDPLEAAALADTLERGSGEERGTGRSAQAALRLLSSPTRTRKVW